MRNVRPRGDLLLVMAGVVLALALALVGHPFDEANARARGATSYCLRTGPHPSGLAMWSENGVHWRMP